MKLEYVSLATKFVTLRLNKMILLAFIIYWQIFTKITHFDLYHILIIFKCRNQNSPSNSSKHEGNRTPDF